MAVIANGVFGIMLARSKRMDFAGVFSVALILAFGGGTLRDLFLDRTPLFWIEKAHYPVIIFVIAIVTSFFPRLHGGLGRLLYLPDALGLGLFSIVGAGYALEAGTTLFIAALLGVVTGTFGGVIADVICNEVPSLFRSAPLYATCSFAGCWVFLLLDRYTRLGEPVVLTAGVVTVVTLRLVALRWNWRLPEHE